MGKRSYRVVGVVFRARETDALIPAVLVVDPDLHEDDDDYEVMRIETCHIDALIAQLRRARDEAETYTSTLSAASPEAREVAFSEPAGAA